MSSGFYFITRECLERLEPPDDLLRLFVEEKLGKALAAGGPEIGALEFTWYDLRHPAGRFVCRIALLDAGLDVSKLHLCALVCHGRRLDVDLSAPRPIVERLAGLAQAIQHEQRQAGFDSLAAIFRQWFREPLEEPSSGPYVHTFTPGLRVVPEQPDRITRLLEALANFLDSVTDRLDTYNGKRADR